MPDLKRNVKDSVFTYLFSQPEYTRQLYLALHPEDVSVTDADLKLVTLENVLSTGQYNDLGFQVRDKLILLVEAQSTFSANIALRMLMYLAATYKEYVEEKMLPLYSAKPVSIPRPELYVVYTGHNKNVPEVLRLSDLYEGPGGVEVEVKVLQDDGTGDILDQYVQFCEVTDQQRRLHGLTQVAVNQTIRICLEQGILTPFLVSRQKEVLSIMVSLFDQEKVWEIERHNIAKDAELEGQMRGLEKGRQEGRQEGEEVGIRALVVALKGVSVGREMIAQELVKQFGLLPQIANEKVEQYWKQ